MKKYSRAIAITGITLGALILAFILLFIFGTKDARRYRTYIRKGDEASYMDYERAIGSYMEALKMAPGSSEALNGLDRAYRNWANYMEDDDLLLAAEIREREANELEAFNEDVHSGNIRRVVSNARKEARRLRQEEAEPDQDPLQPDPTQPSIDFYSDTTDPVDVMKTAYEYLSNGDYESMRTVDGTTAADNVTQVMRDRGLTEMLYSPDYGGESDYTGKAMGIYIVAEGYYFFYGDYKDGLRCGDGCSFWVSSSYTYETFEGEWKDGAPNGNGVIHTVDDSYGRETFVRGNFTDGRQDGTMDYEIWDDYGSTVARGTYDAADGDADAIKLTPTEESFGYEDFGLVPYVRLDNNELVTYYPASEYLAALGFRNR